MLAIKQEKHLLYFDKDKKCFSSFLLEIREKDEVVEKKNKEQQQQQQNQSTMVNGLSGGSAFTLGDITKFSCTFRIQNSFTHKWQSQFYDLKVQQSWGQQPKLHKIPLSLQTYFALYKNPLQWKLSFVLKPKYTDSTRYQEKEVLSKMAKGQFVVGKLIIKSSFMHAKSREPFRLGVMMNSQKDVSQEGKKTVKIVAVKDDEAILCSGQLVEEETCEKVANFVMPLLNSKQSDFRILTFSINPRVNTEHICILKHQLNLLEFQFNKVIIKLYSPEEPQFIPTLAKLFQNLRTMLEIQPMSIVQNVETSMEAADGIVFYSDLITLPQRIFRSMLFDKIEDKWLIQGMVSYSRSNKMFQDCISQLIQLMNQGEQFFPLANDSYHFDQVWKAKARFFFYVLANFKTQRDYGSSTLVGLILEYSQKKKITSTYLFRRLKKKYGLDGSFRSIYQEQFIKSTGLNRIFYQLIDIRRDNSVKFIIRQKSLLNKFFKTYNLFRIKLQQAYGDVSPMMQRIIRKNKYEEMSSKRKDLPGSLAVPEFIKCLPFFRGKMTVESDACEPFQLELMEQNIMEKTKLSSSLRARPAARKPGQTDKGIQGFTWMMIDTAYIFPAVYKNQNVQQNVILQRIKKIYESQQQEIKVLNCISSTNHSENQEICKALLEKLKMQPKTLNTTLSVKRKILQIIPIFINKLKDSTIWQDYFALFQLYEPPCYDYSDDGYQFLTSLIQSSTSLVYKKQFAFYFNQLHRILLSILLNHQIPTSEEKQQRLKNLLYKSLMKWRSKYSFEILKNVYETLDMLVINVRGNLVMIKVIIENLMRFLDEVEGQSVGKTELMVKTRQLIEKCVEGDQSGELYATRFYYDLSKQQKSLSSIDFLRYAFKQLQSLQSNPQKKQHYWLSVKSFKNILQLNKMKWGLKIQLDELNEDQGYFLAEYMWGKMCGARALTQPKVRLQWLKIYRIFYFYFTPIITLHKLKKALRQGEHASEFPIPEQQLQDLLTNCAQLSFIPDIRWMSGYDSSAAKEQKAKYQQYNLQNNRRKRKFQQLTFTQNNIITRFIKENPGKDNWEDIARQALRIIILIEEKKQVDNPEIAERFKRIVQGLKNVQNFLKRGNMPNDYSLDKVKIQAQYVLRQYEEDTQKLQEIFQMVQSAVDSIKDQRRQKEIQKQNEMKIFIPKDWMAIEDEDLNVENTKSLHAIKEYPQEEGEDDERNIMRKIVEDDEKGDGEEIEIDGLGVQRYSSIFEE